MNDLSDLPLGQVLRDEALAQHKANHTEDIQLVRGYLRRVVREMRPTLTADDVMDAVEVLGLNTGDTRWTGSILKGWGLVQPTDQFVPSRRKSRHAAPVRVWRWL